MRLTFSLLLSVGCLAALLAPSAADAQSSREFETPRWSVSVEGRFQATEVASDGDERIDLDGVMPRFSLFLGDEWRIDAFAVLGYATQERFSVEFRPGFRRYFHTSPTGRFRLGSGVATAFQLFDRNERREVISFGPDGIETRVIGKELINVRVVPVEMEYWLHHRGALTLGVDAGGQFYDGGDFEYEGEGITAGFRIRIK